MKKTTVNLIFFIIILLVNPAKAISKESNNPYLDVLLNNIWEVEHEKSDAFPKIMKFFDNGYITDISAHSGENKSKPSFTSTDIDIKYSIINDELEFSTYTFKFKGKITKDSTIKGKGRNGHYEFTKIRVSNNQKLIDYCNSKNIFSFSPLSVFPQYKNKFDGKLNSEINVINTFDFYVAVAVIGDNAASYFLAAPGGKVGFRLIPNGRYKIYYVYYNEPSSLYQGDNITVNNQKITITLEQVTGGNYNIRKSK